jgi:TRAP-type C4-dicarboxylate transport system permease small subunit
MDILALLFATAITAFAVWHSAWLTWDSYDFGDLSIGMVPVPLWIPQAAMVMGLLWLLVALLDALVSLLSGRIAQLHDEAPQE